MTELLAFQSEHGGSVLVEVFTAARDAAPATRGMGTAEAVVQAGDSLERVLGRIGPTVSAIVSELRAGADWPDEVEVEFAVKISADSNVIIARAGGEANFRILLRWSHHQDT